MVCTGSASGWRRARESQRVARADECTDIVTHPRCVPWRIVSASRSPTRAFRESGLTPRGRTLRKTAAPRTQEEGFGTSLRAFCAAPSAGGAMSPRTTSRTYFYYACTVGPSKRHDGCFAKKFHSASELEERVWSAVSAILTDPEKLRTGLDEMIQHERAQMLGDPLKEAAPLGKRTEGIKSRRLRYQEMAAAELIDFDELRGRLAGLEDERTDTERALEATQRRAEHLENLQQNRNVLLEEYAGAVPKRLGALAPEERHRVYRLMRLRAALAPSGDLEISGDVMPAPLGRTETSCLLD